MRVCFLSFVLLSLAVAGCGDDKKKPTVDAGTDAGGDENALVINEVMASNSKSCMDENGEYDDWIELYNGTDAEIDLGGYAITDDATMPFKTTLPEGLKIASKGYLLLWADDGLDQGSTHLPFKLDADGEGVQLYAPGGGLVDEVEWTDAETDVSFARLPDGSGLFKSCSESTCGATNGDSCVYNAPDGGEDDGGV